MLVGTAQSLAKVLRGGHEQAWQRATGLPENPLYRLYRIDGKTAARLLSPNEVSFRNIAIQHYEDGILAGIAGSALAALEAGFFENLDDVTQRVAVTNFFKHSMQTSDGNDLHPLRLPTQIRQKYFEIVRKTYMRKELDILKPDIVIAFNHEIADEIRKAGHPRVFGINDPAWLKRGGSFRDTGFISQLSADVRKLHSGYIAQMCRTYQNIRSENYLAKYHSEFRKEQAPC